MIYKQWFTFIEIIVSITIISLISISSTFYYFDFIWKQELIIYMNDFNKTYKTLNNKVKKQEIFDYTLSINKNSNWYIVSENKIGLDIIQIANFDTANNSWTIQLSPPLDDIWEIKFYDWQKKIKQITQSWLNEITFQIVNNSTIISSLSWSILNNINFYYLNNTNNSDNNISILDIIDNQWESHNFLNINNLNWNIIFNNNIKTINWPISILFQKNGINDTLIIN